MMLPPSTKLPKVGTTIFTVMSQLAAEHGAVNLGQGFPGFRGAAAPGRCTDARDAGRQQPVRADDRRAARCARRSPPRRERCYGAQPDPDTEITVTSGATEAIFDAIHAVVRPGEEVIVLDPCYDCYEPAIDLAGGRAVHVPLDAATFAVDWDAVRAAITPRTRTADDQHAAQSLRRDARRRRHASAGRRCCATPTSAAVRRGLRTHRLRRPPPRDRVLRHPGTGASAPSSSRSFGKTYHCTGWKIGYCVAPPALTAEFRKVHQYNTFCTSRRRSGRSPK